MGVNPTESGKKVLIRAFSPIYEFIPVSISWSLGRLSGTVTVVMLTSLIAIWEDSSERYCDLTKNSSSFIV